MLWIKAFHIITIITWFAGIFYLPRLFVYHSTTTNSSGYQRFQIMEHRLYYGIMTPSFIITTALGLWLLFDYAWAMYGTQYWLMIKLFLVSLLIIYHFICGHFVKVFKHNNNTRSDKFYRFFNELPVLILVAVVVLVVVKPF